MIDAISILLGVIGVIVGVWAILDNRRLRTEREKAVILAHSMIDQAYAALIMIKPFFKELGGHGEYIKAVNNRLAAIDERRSDLTNL